MTISRSAFFAVLPPVWPDDVLPDIRTELAANNRQLVILDDDATGARAVHDVAVLTRWDVPALRAEFARRSRAFFVLTNSRSLTGPAVHTLNLEIARNLRAAAAAEECTFTLVSRGDFSLRGHFPLETDALAGMCGPFDAILFAPFHAAGGSCTVANVHYIADGEMLVPAAETSFARDPVFGYRHSDLRAWMMEKTRSRLAAPIIRELSLETIRRGGPHAVLHFLLNLPRGAHVIVNAAHPRDVETVALATLRAEASGRRLLLRSAADLIAARLAIAPRPLLTGAAVADPDRRRGGLVVVGSYGAVTTAQLERLLATRSLQHVELQVEALLSPERADAVIRDAAERTNAALAAGQDAVLFTSRQFAAAADATGSLKLGAQVSDALAAIVRTLSTRPRFLIAKGGITAGEIASRGLGVRRALVTGQLLPGVPVWQLGPETTFPGLSFVVFPGEIGNAEALADAVAKLHTRTPESIAPWPS